MIYNVNVRYISNKNVLQKELKMNPTKELLSGDIINPPPIGGSISLVDLLDTTFLSYNAGRMRELCHVFTRKMLKEDVTIGVSVAGALTPTGLGTSCLIPLMESGCVNWIVTTGANLYHDIHFALGLPLRRGSHSCNDAALKREGIVRIYDIFFDYHVLLETDAFLRKIFSGEEFQKEMGTAELHYLLGKHLSTEEARRGTERSSVLVSAYRLGIPIYTPSPGDSSIGMNVAALNLAGKGLTIDVATDVNETAAIVYGAKKNGGKSGVLILGGGSPKNFILQTEPHIQEVLGLPGTGHDYFLQVTDARPDTGGLSGATPSEAMSWGKIDTEALPNTVVAYLDTTVALPLLTAYALQQGIKRKQKALYEKRPHLLSLLQQDYCAHHDQS
jgi:deoxyhypusine synthase